MFSTLSLPGFSFLKCVHGMGLWPASVRAQKCVVDNGPYNHQQMKLKVFANPLLENPGGILSPSQKVSAYPAPSTLEMIKFLHLLFFLHGLTLLSLDFHFG